MGLLNRKGAGAEHSQKVEKEIPIVNRLGLACAARRHVCAHRQPLPMRSVG